MTTMPTTAEPAAPTAALEMIARVQFEIHAIRNHAKPNLTPRVRKELRRHVRRLERIEDYLIRRVNERDTP
jgi:hypothetical protein